MSNEQQLTSIGFKFGRNGAHSARGIMVEGLKELRFTRDGTATKQDYEDDIVNFNILHKPTQKSRALTFRHLFDLYCMSMDLTTLDIIKPKN